MHILKSRKRKNTAKTSIEVNDLKIKPIQEGEIYRNVSKVEKVAFDWTIKKGKITKTFQVYRKHGNLNFPHLLHLSHIMLLDSCTDTNDRNGRLETVRN